MNDFEKIIESIQKADTFLLVAHQKPDGDAAGSVTATACGLKSIEKKVDLYLETPMESNLQFLTEAVPVCTNIAAHYDVLMYLDCSTPDYAVLPPVEFTYDQTIVIDHHISNKGFGDLNWVEEVSATGELVYRLLEGLNIPLDETMANAIYTAISTDTGGFTFSDLSRDTFRIIGELYNVRKSYTALAKSLHDVQSYEQMKLQGLAYDSLTLYAEGQIACVTLTFTDIERYGGHANIPNPVMNIGVNVSGVAMGVTFKENQDGTYRVSLRSNEPWPVDVSIPALKYGGGGHYRAAGFTYKGTPEDLITELTEYYNLCMETKHE